MTVFSTVFRSTVVTVSPIGGRDSATVSQTPTVAPSLRQSNDSATVALTRGNTKRPDSQRRANDCRSAPCQIARPSEPATTLDWGQP